MESQTKRILNYLLSGKSLTPMQALKKFGCWALSSRISNIKAMERYNIKSELVSIKGNSKRVAKYSIEL